MDKKERKLNPHMSSPAGTRPIRETWALSLLKMFSRGIRDYELFIRIILIEDRLIPRLSVGCSESVWSMSVPGRTDDSQRFLCIAALETHVLLIELENEISQDRFIVRVGSLSFVLTHCRMEFLKLLA